MKATLFFGVMYRDIAVFEKAKAALVDRYGPISDVSEPFDFDFTTNYEKEFGSGLKKEFLVFEWPIDRDELASIKNWSVTYEKDTATHDDMHPSATRTINLDPGYITPNNVIVASTKDHPHRIYLGDGIFGDLQIILKKDSAVTFPYTYSDYSSHKDFFLSLRTKAPRD